MSIDDARNVDLSTCDREPIHIPGSIQPHGVLFALEEETLNVLQVSENVIDFFGWEASEVLGHSVGELLGGSWDRELHATMPKLVADEPILLMSFEHGGRELNVVGHRSDGVIVVELEPADPIATEGIPLDLHPIVASFITKVQGVPNVPELGKLVANEVRRVTGFDRVLVYRFDEDGTGIVVAEDRNEAFPSLQDHRFPASDVPKQARELYRLNRLRIIPNADYRPSTIVPTENPVTGRPLDLSFSTLRSVSPIHVEYMKNMETDASMSVSVLLEGQLWGLISCHHATPREVPFEARAACDLLAQVFSLQIASRARAADVERRVELKSSLTRLLAHMAEADDFTSGLLAYPDDLLEFVHAAGAAIVKEDACHLIGRTPTVEEVRALASWVTQTTSGEVFSTNHLASFYEPANAFTNSASGLLALSVAHIRPSVVLWFRPEVIETISWGGDPRKSATHPEPSGRIHPRKSFETWRETVRQQATPWLASEIDTAAELRSALLGVVLRKTEELASLSSELKVTNQSLERTNKELEAFSYSVSHDLRAPLRHIAGYAEILKEVSEGKLDEADRKFVDTIIESCEYAGKLVDNLLAFSQMGRAALTLIPVNMNLLISEVRQEVSVEAEGRDVVWHVGEMPLVEADVMMLKLAVRNLLSNALKYSRSRPQTVIEVQCVVDRSEAVFSIRDNGVGFDMRYQDKLFGVFQRLHRWEDYEGTGIGLANVRRIVERHGGRVWAEGAIDQGATFYFTLPLADLSAQKA